MWISATDARCSLCSYEGPVSDFRMSNTRGKRPVPSWCVRCSQDTSYRRRYGLTLLEVEKAKAEGCRVCGTLSGILHVDHDHATGIFRGVLCENCNRGIGMFQDRADLLLKAADYLLAAENFGKPDVGVSIEAGTGPIPKG